jgi:hypothetical protein
MIYYNDLEPQFINQIYTKTRFDLETLVGSLVRTPFLTAHGIETTRTLTK